MWNEKHLILYIYICWHLVSGVHEYIGVSSVGQFIRQRCGYGVVKVPPSCFAETGSSVMTSIEGCAVMRDESEKVVFKLCWLVCCR